MAVRSVARSAPLPLTLPLSTNPARRRPYSQTAFRAFLSPLPSTSAAIASPTESQREQGEQGEQQQAPPPRRSALRRVFRFLWRLWWKAVIMVSAGTTLYVLWQLNKLRKFRRDIDLIVPELPILLAFREAIHRRALAQPNYLPGVEMDADLLAAIDREYLQHASVNVAAEVAPPTDVTSTLQLLLAISDHEFDALSRYTTPQLAAAVRSLPATIAPWIAIFEGTPAGANAPSDTAKSKEGFDEFALVVSGCLGVVFSQILSETLLTTVGVARRSGDEVGARALARVAHTRLIATEQTLRSVLAVAPPTSNETSSSDFDSHTVTMGVLNYIRARILLTLGRTAAAEELLPSVRRASAPLTQAIEQELTSEAERQRQQHRQEQARSHSTTRVSASKAPIDLAFLVTWLEAESLQRRGAYGEAAAAYYQAMEEMGILLLVAYRPFLALLVQWAHCQLQAGDRDGALATIARDGPSRSFLPTQWRKWKYNGVDPADDLNAIAKAACQQ